MLEEKTPNKSKTQPLHFLISLPDFETRNKNRTQEYGELFSYYFIPEKSDKF